MLVSLIPMKRKILLIEPPFYRLFDTRYSLHRYPLSLGYLAGTIVEKTDWEVIAYNADFNQTNRFKSLAFAKGKGFEHAGQTLKDLSVPLWQEVRRTITEFQPDVVGITSKSQNFSSACNVAKIAKETNENIKVIVGGSHVSMVGRDVLDCANIDIAVTGEGEATIVELLDTIDKGCGLSGVEGAIYREDGVVVENPKRKFIKDLDSLCFPHDHAQYVLKDFEQYPPEAFANIFTIRGCPHNCFFCGSRQIWSRCVRYRSIGNIIREIRGLQRMGVRGPLRFDDDTFGVRRQRIIKLCDSMGENFPSMRWECELHVKLVDDEIISKMKKAGCFRIQLGIESGNNEILRQIRKNTTIEESLRACNIIKKHGLELEGFFMVGFPQETEETLKDTVKAIKRSNCDLVEYSIFTPYPGTEAYTYCQDRGLISENYNTSFHFHQSPTNFFTEHIEPERFKFLTLKIEKIVRRKNYLNALKRIFSLRLVISKIQEQGLAKSLRKGVKLIIHR